MMRRDKLAEAIDDAKDSLDAIYAAFVNGDDAALRWVTQKQLAHDLSKVAHALGNEIANREKGVTA